MKLLDKIKIQAVLAFIVIAGGLSIIAFVNVNDSDKIGIFGIMGVVLGFYFGSSKSSNTKDETISDLSKK
jgi:hypothetical protein